jgi:hypothetical protein
MTSFEGIIRPFQSVDVTYPRRIIKPGAATTDENVVFVVGKNGGSKSISMSLSISQTSYMDKVQNESTEPNPDPEEI